MKNTVHQSKTWAYVTSFMMSFNGGYINAICMLSLLGIPVGYVTGNLTMSADAIKQGSLIECLYLIALVLCFLLGSIMSGLLVKSQHFKMDRRYAATIILQSVTLFLAMILLHYHELRSGYLLALTMGMQNAMTTHYGSALIRTTHMTGTTTDLGILISRWIKGDAIEYWKMALYLSLILGFLAGAIAGSFLYSLFAAFSLSLCFIFYLIMIAWPIIKRPLEE